MRTRRALGSIFATVTILTVGWQAGTIHTATTTASTASGTYTGTSVATRFGNVQVEITVVGKKITEVTALHLTDHDGRSIAISAQAAPILRSEVLASQSAKVASVSGATYTSEGYLTSLQAAIDKAGI